MYDNEGHSRIRVLPLLLQLGMQENIIMMGLRSVLFSHINILNRVLHQDLRRNIEVMGFALSIASSERYKFFMLTVSCNKCPMLVSIIASNKDNIRHF